MAINRLESSLVYVTGVRPGTGNSTTRNNLAKLAEKAGIDVGVTTGAGTVRRSLAHEWQSRRSQLADNPNDIQMAWDDFHGLMENLVHLAEKGNDTAAEELLKLINTHASKSTPEQLLTELTKAQVSYKGKVLERIPEIIIAYQLKSLGQLLVICEGKIAVFYPELLGSFIPNALDQISRTITRIVLDTDPDEAARRTFFRDHGREPTDVELTFRRAQIAERLERDWHAFSDTYNINTRRARSLATKIKPEDKSGVIDTTRLNLKEVLMQVVLRIHAVNPQWAKCS